jgi:hypothetical protein
VADVDDIDGFLIERLKRCTKLVHTILMIVDGVIMNGGGEEVEEARGEG